MNIRFAPDVKPSEVIFTGKTARRIREISSATAVFRRYEIREITVVNFHTGSFRCAQRNLLMQIRRSYNAWMRMNLIDDPRERFVSFSPSSSDCRYQITALNFHALTSGPRDFHTPLLPWNLLKPIKRACPEQRRKIPLSMDKLYVCDLISAFALECLSTGGTSIESNFTLALTVTELSS